MKYIDAHKHLAHRVEQTNCQPRQYWSKRDREALNILLLRPTAPERVALARIEGRTAQLGGLTIDQKNAIHTLARQGLGL